MRKLIVCNIMSLDGYFEGPDNNVMDLFKYRFETYPTDESFDSYNAERLRAADTLLVGRTMYDQIKGYWPGLAGDSNAPPIEREVEHLLNTIDKVVISNSLIPAETEPWQNSTRIINRADAPKQIAKLKRQTGKDILILGSRTLWNDLLGQDLVDELHLMISPVALGAGTPIFEGKPSVSFRLIDTNTWKGSGIVLTRYEVLRQKT
jgi:dihydrofolate reductase